MARDTRSHRVTAGGAELVDNPLASYSASPLTIPSLGHKCPTQAYVLPFAGAANCTKHLCSHTATLKMYICGTIRPQPYVEAKAVATYFSWAERQTSRRGVAKV